MSRSLPRSLLCLAALTLALAAWPGCGEEQEVAPTEAPPGVEEPEVVEPEEPEEPAVHEHAVQAGENLSRIARRYQVTVRSIARANELSASEVNNLRIGRVLQRCRAP